MFGFNMAVGLLALVAAPLDEEMKASFQGECSVEIVSKVIKSGDSYTYMYSVKNVGKQPIKFKWSILNKAMQYGADIDLLFDLNPGENLNFVLEHPDPPVAAWGVAQAYHAVKKEEFDDMMKHMPQIPKGVKMQMPKKSLLEAETRGVNSVLPKGYNPQFGVR